MNLTQEDTGDVSLFLGAATVMLLRASAPADSTSTPVSRVEAKGFAPLYREEGVLADSAPTPVSRVEAKGFAPLDRDEGVPGVSALTLVSRVEAKGFAPLDREEGAPSVSAPDPV